MVNGIFTIPLGGRVSQCASDPVGAAQSPAAFIAGPENRLADCALRPFLEQAATDFSPLVLYGPHGAGKSHLAGGLVAWWTRQYPTKQARRVGASEFAREHATALAKHQSQRWRRELHGLALFVLEDLGQLAGKRTAQQELIHLLDALADRDVPVVVTARSLPARSAVLLPALRSRLSAGLAVPVSLPGRATRRVILEQLAATRGLALSKRTVHGLADALAGSVPMLAAALLELDLLARTEGRPVDRRRIRRFVTDRQSASLLNLREIASVTGKYFGLTLAELRSPNRRQPLVAARGVAMYLARQLTGKSFEEIGAYFGRRDHTTVLHGCRRTESLLPRDSSTRHAVTELKRLLNA